MNRDSITRLIPLLTLCCFFILIFVNFFYVVETDPFVSSDFPAHLALIRLLQGHLLHGRIGFYDSSQFLGWPAFEFYGFGGHLVLALVADLTSFFFTTPLQKVVLVTLLFQAALLPFSVYFAASAIVPQRSRSESLLLALFAGLLSFWFLNHPQSDMSIGAAAIFQMGLVPQLLAWHLALLHLGFIFRGISKGSSPHIYLGATLTFAALLLTHELTASFMFYCSVCFFLFFDRARIYLAAIYTVALSLTGFWLIPFLAYSKDYAVFSALPFSGDLLSLLFRYPLNQLFDSLRNLGLLVLGRIDLTFIILMLLSYAVLFLPKLRRHSLLIAPFLVFVFGELVFSSPIVQVSLPFALHYYRYQGFALCVLLATFAAAPVILMQNLTSSCTRVKRAALYVIPIFAFVTSYNVPNLIQQQWTNIPKDFYASQDQVLELLRNQQGRVLFENGYNEKVFSLSTPHYMPAELFFRTGRETLNGLFAHSSFSYIFSLISLKGLGADLYSIDVPVSKEATNISTEARINYLKETGVTQIVAYSDAFTSSLANFLGQPSRQVGPYKLFDLDGVVTSPVQCLKRPLVGYLGESSTLPFRFIELYFHSRESLQTTFTSVNLAIDDLDVVSLDVLLINTETYSSDAISRFYREHPQLKSPTILEVNPINLPSINSTKPNYEVNRESYYYLGLENYFDRKLEIRRKLKNLTLSAPPCLSSGSYSFKFSPDGQSFEIDNLEIGKPVLINYSYFPYWQSSQAQLFRSQGERMLLVPEATKITANYSRYSSRVVWVGILLSLLGLVLLVSFAVGVPLKLSRFLTPDSSTD